MAVIVEAEVFSFTNEEWATVAGTAKVLLSNDARRQIELAITFYRGRSTSRYTSLKTKRTLLSARKFSEKLSKHLETLRRDKVFRFSGRIGFFTAFKDETEGITRAMDALSSIDALLDDAATRISKKPGRKSSQDLVFFIEDLMAIYKKHTGSTLARSMKTGTRSPSNPFITACALIAAPSIPKSRINTCLVEALSIHHRLTGTGRPAFQYREF